VPGALLLPSAADEAFARGLAALQAGKAGDAERLFKKTLDLQPRHVPALNLCGVLLTQMRRFEEAEQYVTRAIEENPTSDATFYNYGVILKALKRFDEAIAQFDRALAIKGSVPETLNARGDVLLELDRPEQAIADFDKALAIAPNFVDALVNKARALSEDDPKAALALTERALALQPNHALAWLASGDVLHHERRYERALECFGRAAALQPDLAEAWLGRGDALHELRQNDQAAAAYEKALALKPDLAAAHNALGVLVMEQGRIDDARAMFRKAIELEPAVGEFHWQLAATKKFSPGDPDLAAMEALAAGATSGRHERMMLDFALGQAYADAGEHRRSFQHLLAATAEKRSTIAYDEAVMLSRLDSIAKTFTRDLIAAKTVSSSGAGGRSPRPIFIIGMPRSGSTLLEQILASHPAVEAVGEVAAFPDAIFDVIDKAPDGQFRGMEYPDFVPVMDDQAVTSIGERYLVRIAKLASSNRERTVDKMLDNFRYAGLIHLALPDAVILHTSRNALDTCISCFSKPFNNQHYYSYDLAELGRYHKHYQRLMQHWHRVLPPGRILDVQYEDVVADLEGQARRIIAHCGLPWDERCLAFHETERRVRTASLAQVRRPIYKSSVSRWKVYEEFLGPLFKELEIDPHAAE
jgi:tetratricopeptide (TPR) repeat protein